MEEKLGAKHPWTLLTIQDLANVYTRKSRYGEAEGLFKWALAGMVVKLGEKHPKTLGTVEELAGVLEKQNRFDDAGRLRSRYNTG
jgi:hypothetical protein